MRECRLGWLHWFPMIEEASISLYIQLQPLHTSVSSHAPQQQELLFLSKLLEYRHRTQARGIQTASPRRIFRPATLTYTPSPLPASIHPKAGCIVCRAGKPSQGLISNSCICACIWASAILRFPPFLRYIIGAFVMDVSSARFIKGGKLVAGWLHEQQPFVGIKLPIFGWFLAWAGNFSRGLTGAWICGTYPFLSG